MRRVLILCIVATALLGGRPGLSGAQDVGAGVLDVREASASWLEKGPNRPTWYVVEAGRYESDDGSITTLVAVGRGRCKLVGRGRAVEARCRNRMRINFIPAHDFGFDRTLKSAWVKFRDQGRFNEMTWTGRDEAPRPDYYVAGAKRWIGAGVTLWKRADVRGRLLGRRVARHERGMFAAVYEGVEADAIVDLMDAWASGERELRLRRTFRLR